MFEQVPQPMYINGNAYLRGGDGTVAPSFAGEQTKYVAQAGAVDDEGTSAGADAGREPVGVEGIRDAIAQAAQSQARITTEPDGSVWLDLDADDALLSLPTIVIDSELLGTPRIVTEPFVNPDGTALAVDTDLTGAARSATPMPGPVESLTTGHNHIRLA